MNLLIKNVNIVDSKKSIYGEVLIKDGIIQKVTDGNDSIIENDIEVIDGNGLTLLPSFIDMHTHLREPGYTYKEDLESGQKAALKGGFTHLVAMANTNPVCDNIDTMKYIKEKVEKLNLCDIYQVCSVTKELKGKDIVNINEMREYTKVFSDDGVTIFNEEIMKKALELSKENDFTILTHCQPEYEIVKRDLEILEETEGNLHICHISKKDTIDIIKKYKDNGYKFSCEVTPHHIFSYGLDYKVNPSIRKKEDVLAMLEGIKNGYIDVIGTDHAPHSEEDKLKGSPGISLIEVAFSMVYKVFKENNISINKLSEMMSYNPSKILKINNTGLIEKGYDANLVLVDLDNEYKIDTNNFTSKGKNNPFNGVNVNGNIRMTIKRGEIKYDNR